MLPQILPALRHRGTNRSQPAALRKTIEAQADGCDVRSALEQLRRDALQGRQQLAGTLGVTPEGSDVDPPARQHFGEFERILAISDQDLIERCEAA